MYLIFCELGGIGEYHVLHFRRVVSCGQSQTSQCVPTCSILTNNRQDIFLDTLSEGDFSVTNPDMSASVNYSFWGPLGSRTEMQNMHTKSIQIKSYTFCFILPL